MTEYKIGDMVEVTLTGTLLNEVTLDHGAKRVEIATIEGPTIQINPEHADIRELEE